MNDTLCDSITGDQQLLIEATRKYARDRLIQVDRQADRDESSVCHILPDLSEMGLLALKLPEDYGGLGVGYETYAAIIHEISYASPSVAVTLCVHSMVGEVLLNHATDEVKRELLPYWNLAENLACFAVSEADAGSDPSAATTFSELRGDHYETTGSKMWITNGIAGRWFATLVRTTMPDGVLGHSALLIDGHEPGFERLPIHGKMGIRGSETVSLHLAKVRSPQHYLLSSPGKGLLVFLSALNGGRIGIASQATGIAEACLDEMTAYAGQRKQFDRPLGEFQAIQNMIADSAMELAASKALIAEACRRADLGQLDPAASAKAKLYATESANRIAYRAVQIHGGSGYVNDFRVEQLYRDARVTTIYEGASEIQRIVIGRELKKHGIRCE